MKSKMIVLVLAACTATAGGLVLAQARSGLQLSCALDAAVVDEGSAVGLTITLTNEGGEDLSVLSHVATHETHLDWYTVRLEPLETCTVLPGKKSQARTLRFSDARDKSAPVTKLLHRGDLIHHTVDLQAWAQREINGKQPLAPGCYNLEAIYEVRGQKGVWNGELRSSSVPLTIRPRPRP